MKIIVFLSTTVLAFILSQSNDFSLNSEKTEIEFKTIKIEVEWFIERVKCKSYKQGKHNVYAVKIYEGKDEGSFCFTVGYFNDYYSFSRLKKFNYYMYLNDELILFDYSNDFNEKYLLKDSDCLKVLQDQQIITAKIDMNIEALGTWPEYVCCYKNDKIIKVFYENSDEISSEIDIFNLNHNSSGTITEVDSTIFKEILNAKTNENHKNK